MNLGIALSGGGTRGLAHAGALKALDEHNIKIDMIAGTSSGSIVALLYAIGVSPYYIYILTKKYARELVGMNNITIVSEIGNFMVNKKIRMNGFKSGEGIENAIGNITAKRGIKTMQDVKMPLLIPAVDISNSTKYLFVSQLPQNLKLKNDSTYITNIPVGKAVRASCSFPMIFSPCMYENHIFMDGGILDNIPAQEIRKYNVKKIISIKFSSDKVTEDSNMMEIIMKTVDIMGNKISEESLAQSDLVITVPSDGTGLLDTDKLDLCYKEGYDIISKNIDKIKKVIDGGQKSDVEVCRLIAEREIMVKKFFGKKDDLKECIENLGEVKAHSKYEELITLILAGAITLGGGGIGSIENVYAEGNVPSYAAEQQELNESDDIAQEWYVTTPEGENWLNNNLGWLDTETGRHWLQENPSCSWLLSKAGENWLNGKAGQKWLKELEKNSVKFSIKGGSMKWTTIYKGGNGEFHEEPWKECLKVKSNKLENPTYNNRYRNEERGGR